MGRVARKHVVDRKGGGFHHCLNRICGYPGEYPLHEPAVEASFISRLRSLVLQFRVGCAGFALMGNHFHLVLRTERRRKLSRCKLRRYAKARWGALWRLRTGLWSEARWRRFNDELFDLSLFMKQLQGPFASWFNKVFGRRGRFWGDRFKSLALGHDLAAVRELLAYVELNPVRAGLVPLPELYRACSAHLRAAGEGDWLIPLEELFPELARAKALPFYRALLLHRGLGTGRGRRVPARAGEAVRALLRGAPPPLYRKRRRFMSDGLMMGGRDRLQAELERLTAEGLYRRRRNVKEHLGGLFRTIREQRSHGDR